MHSVNSVSKGEVTQSHSNVICSDGRGTSETLAKKHILCVHWKQQLITEGKELLILSQTLSTLNVTPRLKVRKLQSDLAPCSPGSHAYVVMPMTHIVPNF